MALPPHVDPGRPDTRGPGRYLWWVTRKQPGRALRGALWSCLWLGGLGILILAGVPALAVVVGPLLGRLQRSEAEYRRQQGELTAGAAGPGTAGRPGGADPAGSHLGS